MIEVEGLGVRRGGFRMEGVQFSVRAGGYGVMIGPTGAGKTTLLDLIAGHVRAEAGRIVIAGRDATHLPPEARGVGIVYQRHHLFPHLDVRANVGYGLVHRRDRPEPAAQRVADVARALGIAHLLDRSVDGLSGGERQRVALARALAPRPHVLLLDEPLASLDPRTRRHMRDELRRAHAAEGSTVLHVTHDFEDALTLGDQVAVMHEGRLLQSGAPVDVFRKPVTPFVAEFIGSGNVLAGVVEEADGGRALFRSGPLALQIVSERRGGCHALIQPEEILVSRTPFPSPPRNHLEGRIERIEITGPLATVHLDVGVGVAALLTRVSVEEMALRPGDTVRVAVKATAIHIM